MIDIKPLFDTVPEPNERNRKEWQAAEEALQENVDRLQAKSAVDDDQFDTFANKLEVWRFLKEEGWEIGRSQFYAHCLDGLLRPDRETGSYKLDAVERYAKLNLRLTATGAKINKKLDKYQEKKAEVELETAKIKLQREKHNLGVKKRNFIPRDEFELSVVGRTVAMLAHLKHMVQLRTPDWIDLVAGDQERAADLRVAMIEEIEQRLSVFARDVEFDVILEADR